MNISTPYLRNLTCHGCHFCGCAFTQLCHLQLHFSFNLSLSR